MQHIDYDIHGLVGVRLIDPSPGDAAVVARQLGPLQRPLNREPDIRIHFYPRLDTPPMHYLGLEANGFTEDGFFILRSGKAAAKVQIDFSQIGGLVDIRCQSGLKSVPLLLAIVNLTMLQRDCVALHASAFVHEGQGIVVTGWAKGGKSEALLAFAENGAQFVGDEWIVLSGDGTQMYGIPENMRLWDWHLEHLPRVRQQVKRENLLLFRGIHWLDRLQQNLPDGRIGRSFPAKALRQAMPALKRQLNVQLSPEKIFGKRLGPFCARPDRIFLVMSHEADAYTVETTTPEHIARRMIASVQYELLPFMEHYLAFKFAFPEKQNPFLETLVQRQAELLQRALAGKAAFIVRHPYPFSFEKLRATMLEALDEPQPAKLAMAAQTE